MREGFFTLQLRHFFCFVAFLALFITQCLTQKKTFESLSNVKNCNILKIIRNRRNIMNNNEYSQVNVLFLCDIFFCYYISIYHNHAACLLYFLMNSRESLESCTSNKIKIYRRKEEKKLIKTAENLTM